VWEYSNTKKSTILEHVLGIFEIFEGGKGTPNPQSRKIYLVDTVLTHQSGQIFLEPVLLHLGDSRFWLKIQSLEKM